jgi:hypothetical protein
VTTINGVPVKVFDCIASGSLSLKVSKLINPNDAAFGSWEFWIKHQDGATTYMGFATSDTTPSSGYSLRIPSTEVARIWKYGVGYLGTGFNVPVDTWFKIRITRDNLGVIKVYYNDVLSDTTAADLTTMSANYMVLTLSTGDKIAIASPSGNYAITKYLGVV